MLEGATSSGRQPVDVSRQASMPACTLGMGLRRTADLNLCLLSNAPLFCCGMWCSEATDLLQQARQLGLTAADADAEIILAGGDWAQAQQQLAARAARGSGAIAGSAQPAQASCGVASTALNKQHPATSKSMLFIRRILTRLPAGLSGCRWRSRCLYHCPCQCRYQ